MKTISLSSIKDVSVTPQGLSELEVQKQRATYGTNAILDENRNRWFEIFQDTLRDPMMWFLVIVSVLFFATGQTNDGLVMLVAVIPLTLMDAFLHWRTKSATTTLRQNLDTTARVFRNGKEDVINAEEIVPGDLIKVRPGGMVPADGLVEVCDDFQMDESVLTGESLPVKKNQYAEKILKRTGEFKVEDSVLVYAGTKVLFGEALIRVIRTGRSTEYGEIVRSVSEVQHSRTPLQEDVSKLLKYMVSAGLFFCLVLILVRKVQGHSWLDSFLAGMTLAVAAMPEEFPVAFTFYLGLGVFRLARRRALVRRAVSVENIGRITHICTDKTGTITQGKLELAHLVPYEEGSEARLLTAAIYASNIESGDPIDVAIMGFDKSKIQVQEGIAFLKRFPFTEDRRKETAIAEINGQISAFCKGAPENILASVALSESEKQRVFEKINELAGSGHKVLACSVKKLTSSFDGDEPASGFEFLGLLAFEDPARPEVRLAIAEAQKNQIKVIIITGDHPATSGSIAKDVGLGGGTPQVISAEEHPEKFEPDYLAAHPLFLDEVDVVARCTPKQKLNIVVSLKQKGAIVAVTGDGVNDVPALKAADVAIAMGERGSQSAKEVSSIVLADDNFKTIIGAIEEGRRLFQNMRASFEYLLLIHIPLVLCAALIPLGGYPIIFLPIHIVWLELIIHPTAILAFQSKLGDDRYIKTETSYFFDKKDVFVICITGAAITILLSFMFISGLSEGSEALARTKILSGLSFWSVLTVIILTKGEALWSKIISIGTVLCVFILVQYGGQLSERLHLAPLSAMQWTEVLWPVLLAGAVMVFMKNRSVREKLKW